LFKIESSLIFSGRRLFYLPECQSTNDYAAHLLANKPLNEGSVIITNNQTKGRGQRGNNWISTEGKNLTLSVIFKPQFLNVQKNFMLNIFVSLALFDFFFNLRLTDLKIKWPNDLMTSGKKLAGILIENFLRLDKINDSIVGLGINVNQQHFQLPGATSLKLATGKTYDLNKLLNLLLIQLDAYYLKLKNEEYDLLKSNYVEKLFWLHEEHTFGSQLGEFQGTIIGIDDYGRLKVEADNQVKVFDLKEIRFLS